MYARAKAEDKKNVKGEANRRPKRESSRTRVPKSYYEEEVKTKRTKSPARSRSTGRKKSPARDKSASRDESTQQRKSKRVAVSSPKKSASPSWKSPARKSPSRRSPGRKSPSRTSPARLKVESDKKIHASTPLIDADTESDSDLKPLKLTARSRISLLKSSSTPIKEIEKRESTPRESSFFTKRSSVLSSLRSTERIVHLNHDLIITQEKNLTEFSDEDDLPVQSKRIDSIESRPYKVTFVTEFGGWFGAVFLIVFLPVFGLGLHIFCNDKQCAYNLPDLTPYKKLSAYFDVTAFLSFSAYLIILMLLSALPFGGETIRGNLSKYGRTTYVANGWISVIVTHLILIGLELSGIHVMDYIYDKFFHLVVAAMLHGFLFSIYLYVKSFYIPISALNPNGDTNSLVYNFFMGREINPVICGVVNVKILLLRYLYVSWILFTTITVLKSLSLTSFPLTDIITTGQFDFTHLNIEPTILTYAVMAYVASFDGILLLEKAWSTSFDMQYEGVGYMSGCLWFLYTSLIVLPIKYLHDYSIKLNGWLLTVAFLQFLIGYFIYSRSNYQKYLFRKNPYSPAVAELETIPTSLGKKLIVSGYWGLVRHPNYLGDIILELSLFYFVYNVPPGLVYLLTIPMLMHRAKRDGFRCKQKYDGAWERYCQRVRYMIIPKIY